MGRIVDFWKGQKPVIENMLLRHDAAEIDPLERAEVLGYLPPLAGLGILDLGAGIGRFTGELARIGAHVTAQDLVPQFIEQNRRNNSPLSNITYLCSDVRSCDFPTETFDLVFVSGLFMYLEDDELAELVSKIFSWLKPGGYLFFRDSCSSQAKTTFGTYAIQRPIHHYHKLMDVLFTHINSGSIQVYIDRFADPFRCFWLYRKDTVKSCDKLI